jgi:YesN/AraC family two-component response regulator
MLRTLMLLRLLIVDDHEVVRLGLRRLLESSRPEWQICGEAEDGAKAIAKALELAPDVVIVDLAMPVMNGVQAATEI